MVTEGKHPLKEYYSKIYRRYDLVNRIFTFGMDVKWRRETADKCLSFHPKKVIDVCCGTGDLAIQLATEGDELEQISAYDFNQQMLEVAKRKAEKLRLSQITFQQGDVAQMPYADDEFDAITIGFGFRNLVFENANAGKHAAELNRILKQGGRLFILESGVPKLKVFRVLYMIYLKLILIPLGGAISGNWKAYRYLAGSSIRYFSMDQLQIFLSGYGLKVEAVKSYLFGSTNLVTAIKTNKLD